MGNIVPINGSGNGGEKRPPRGPSMNTVTLLGRLVADPRVHVTADGIHISEVRVVTNDRQEPEFHDVVTYRRLAELVGECTRKGSLVLVQGHCTATAGRLRTAASGSAPLWSAGTFSSSAGRRSSWMSRGDGGGNDA